MLGTAFRLESFHANLNSPTPYDKMVFFKEVTFDANGQAVVDLSEYKFPPLTNIYWVALSTCGVFPRIDGVDPAAAGTFGTAGITMTSYSAGLSLTAVAASGNEPAVVIPAASKTVMVMFIADCSIAEKGA